MIGGTSPFGPFSMTAFLVVSPLGFTSTNGTHSNSFGFQSPNTSRSAALFSLESWPRVATTVATLSSGISTYFDFIVRTSSRSANSALLISFSNPLGMRDFFSSAGSPSSPSLLLLEQPRGEVVERVAPGLPFVGEPLDVAEDHVLDAGLLQRLVEGLRALVNARVEADGAGMEVEQAHLLVKGFGVGEHAAESRLRVEPACPSTESAD